MYDRPVVRFGTEVAQRRNRLRRRSPGVEGSNRLQRFLRALSRSREPYRMLEGANRVLAEEVHALEHEACCLPVEARRDGSSIRKALELLRNFSRSLAQDLPVLPDETRASLLTHLKLEHRRCYAAAGTTRTDFEHATGRTGAR